jgi:hypothetical protein
MERLLISPSLISHFTSEEFSDGIVFFRIISETRECPRETLKSTRRLMIELVNQASLKN